jgi:hypothetical protein
VSLELQPIGLREALTFVERHHRHHGAPQGGKFAVAVNGPCECGGPEPTRFTCEHGCEDGRRVVGVAVVGRPVSKERDDGWTAEVTRVCVLEGNPNACSMLYAAAWRAARALGYRRMGTYILAREPGTSLRAAGWRFVGLTEDARGWNRRRRPRVDTHPLEQKELWEATA